MEWSDQKLIPLKIGTHKHFSGRNQQIFETHKQEILDKSHNVCSYCGGKYKKLSQCVFSNKSKPTKSNMVACCTFCYIVSNFSSYYIQHIEIRQSKMTQLQIIRKTSNYIFQNNCIPTPEQVDPKVEPSTILANQYFVMGNAYKDIAKHHKIFIKDSLTVSYICNIIVDYFTEEYEDVETNTEQQNNKISDSVCTDNMESTLNAILKRYIKYIQSDKRANALIDIEYKLSVKTFLSS